MWFKVILLLLGTVATKPTNDSQFHSGLEKFSKNIFSEIYATKGQESIIFSPFSIQTCLSMVRMGADGQTALEMDQGLGFAGQSEESVANNYHSMLAQYEKSNIVQIANKVYVNMDRELKGEYKEVLSQKFFSSAENIDFGQSAAAAKTMNSWVESKTDNAIKDLVKEDMVSGDTVLYLLSAIHFKGDWKNPFPVEDTTEQDFYTDETNTVKVQMMSMETMMAHSDMSEIDATAVRMPYKDSDLSMVIILPNSRNGLAEMLDNLKYVSLESVSQQLKNWRGVSIQLPKFKTEFEIELSDTLKKLGMKQMFGAADFDKMLKSSESLKVSHAVHKAFIEVNEVGTEAAAATAIGIVTRSRPEYFTADHPFYYVIMNKDAVPLFQGTFTGY